MLPKLVKKAPSIGVSPNPTKAFLQFWKKSKGEEKTPEYIVQISSRKLLEECKSAIDQVEGRDTPPTITELHERLLNHEAKLLSASTSLPPTFSATDNMIQQRINSNTNQHYRQGYNKNNAMSMKNKSNYNWQQQQQNKRHETHGPDMDYSRQNRRKLYRYKVIE